MNLALRTAVRERANGCCEYCGIPQALVPFAHHVEHVLPRKHGGITDMSNLALACIHCNLHKGPNLTGIDESTGKVTALFNPRVEAWNSHFRREGVLIVGVTDVGRATVTVMNMNAMCRQRLRERTD